RDVGATPDWEEGFRLCRLSGTKPECALESTVSQSVRLSRIGWRTRGGACPCVRPEATRRGSHTSQKARCMRHPRLGGWVPFLPTFGNEAGMCPGINGFTACAPIADWVAHAWRCSPVVGPGALRRGSHTSQKARCMRNPSREEGFRLCRLPGAMPECALESTVSQSVHLSRIGWRTRGGACYVC